MKKIFLLLAAVGVIFTACTEGDSLEDNNDTPTEQPGDGTDDGNGDQGGEEIPDDAYISLNKDILTFAPDGESVDVKVYCNYEWTLTNNCDWVTTSVSGGEASEEGTTITLTTDLTYDDHEGTIIFSCGKAKKVLVVSQSFKEAIIADDSNTFNIPAEGGIATIVYQTTIDCEVIIPEEAKEWITIAPATRGLVSESINLNVAENTTYSTRTAVVKVVAKDNSELFAEYTINQEQKDGLLVDGDNVFNLDCRENTITIKHKTNVDCEVIIPEEAKEWITIAPATRGLVSESINLNVAENTTYSARTAVVTVVAKDKSELFVEYTINQNRVFFIAYTSSDGKIVTPCDADAFNATIVSNTYENGVGVIGFAAPVTSIGDNAFEGCHSLTSVTIPNSVTEIGSAAFYYCSRLTSVTIPNSVTKIGDGTFQFCSSLKSVTIPNSVTSIGNRAFEGCLSLTSVYISDLSAWCKIDFKNYDSNPLYYEAALYLNNAVVTEFTIPSDITKIKPHAFSGCSSLTSVTIPNSVTEIGEYAFYCCSSLASIKSPESVNSIGKNAFCYCTSLKSITIPDSVTSIGFGAFQKCTSLTSVTIPDSVTSIGGSAFYNCTSLASVTIGDRVTSIGDRAFNDCTSLTSVTIGNGVNSIGNRAFEGCLSLTSIKIPESVNSIGNYAFSGCTGELIINSYYLIDMDYGAYNDNNCPSKTWLNGSKFTKLTIGDNISSLGKYTFYGCSSLTSVTIPNSVTWIGNYAFYRCSSLTSVYCLPTTPPTVGYCVFDYNASGRVIVVPMPSVLEYYKALHWSDYASDIVYYDFE